MVRFRNHEPGMRHRLLAAAFAALSLLPSARARAEYVPDFDAWLALPEAARVGFATGALDQFLVLAGDGPEDTALRLGATACMDRLRPNSAVLARAVGDAYAAHPEVRGRPAVSVLRYVLLRLCEAEIDARLRAGGFPPITAAAFLANMARPPQ